MRKIVFALICLVIFGLIFGCNTNSDSTNLKVNQSQSNDGQRINSNTSQNTGEGIICQTIKLSDVENILGLNDLFNTSDTVDGQPNNVVFLDCLGFSHSDESAGYYMYIRDYSNAQNDEDYVSDPNEYFDAIYSIKCNGSATVPCKENIFGNDYWYTQEAFGKTSKRLVTKQGAFVVTTFATKKGATENEELQMSFELAQLFLNN
ncbi:MAG: hypothetical protein HOE11_04415 [Candidatus Diapherotrites archaeon]|jgi:hypothetical protein|nr:hypothetical protein [Candidatus Diapherotrites archaeon]MBT4597028.1 hypothetical protein [Candidatus Diapherotrites archaeon]